MNYLRIVIFCSSLILISCENNNEEDLVKCGGPADDTTNVTYNFTVKKILDDNCVTCHRPGNANGNVRLDDYANAKHIGEELKDVLRFDNSAANMPPSGKLDECTINKVSAWINQGYKE
jgi:mono/diheme cytochrome c family protein